MIAVLADPSLYDEPPFRSSCDCAAVNYSSHFVVSAAQPQCLIIENRLKALEVPWQRLAVSHPFHSRWMDTARVHFASFMNSVPIRKGTLPLMCCDRAVTLTQLDAAFFWDVTRRPIRFPQAIGKLEQTAPYRFVDVGPSGTLATFLKYVLPPNSRSTVHAVLTPYGRDLENWGRLTSLSDRGEE
jgi:bacillaene synthase trans-acting acyltransferase